MLVMLVKWVSKVCWYNGWVKYVGECGWAKYVGVVSGCG